MVFFNSTYVYYMYIYIYIYRWRRGGGTRNIAVIAHVSLMAIGNDGTIFGQWWSFFGNIGENKRLTPSMVPISLPRPSPRCPAWMILGSLGTPGCNWATADCERSQVQPKSMNHSMSMTSDSYSLGKTQECESNCRNEPRCVGIECPFSRIFRVLHQAGHNVDLQKHRGWYWREQVRRLPICPWISKLKKDQDWSHRCAGTPVALTVKSGLDQHLGRHWCIKLKYPRVNAGTKWVILWWCSLDSLHIYTMSAFRIILSYHEQDYFPHDWGLTI
jgi:hypothetical protein